MIKSRKIVRSASVLLQRNPDLVVCGRDIVVTPIRHFMRFVMMDGASNPDVFRPRWAMSHLFQRSRRRPTNYVGDISFPQYGLWRHSDPATPQLFAQEVERDALPFLRSVVSLADYVAFGDAAQDAHDFQWTTNHIEMRLCIVRAAMGDIDRALHDCERTAAGLTQWSRSPDLKDEVELVVQELLPRLRSGDRASIAQLLHSWEAFTVNANKLEHLWKPTPFPIETGGGGS